MFPILFSFGPIKVYTFGLFLFLAVVLAAFVIWREGRRIRLDEDLLMDLLVFEAIFGLVGARIYYILSHFGSFGLNPFKWLLIFHFPGLSFIGGLLAGIIGAFIFSRKTKVSFWQIGDFLVLGVSLGEAIGRIGAFLSGSAYGSPTNLFLGLPVIGVLSKRHPVQIYESIVSFLIFIFLIRVKRTLQEKKFSAGILFSLYLFLFGLTKFFLEFFRGEVVYLGGWRLTQIICLMLIIFSPALFFKRLGKAVKEAVVIVWQGILKKFKAR